MQNHPSQIFIRSINFYRIKIEVKLVQLFFERHFMKHILPKNTNCKSRYFALLGQSQLLGPFLQSSEEH